VGAVFVVGGGFAVVGGVAPVDAGVALGCDRTTFTGGRPAGALMLAAASAEVTGVDTGWGCVDGLDGLDEGADVTTGLVTTAFTGATETDGVGSAIAAPLPHGRCGIAMNATTPAARRAAVPTASPITTRDEPFAPGLISVVGFSVLPLDRMGGAMDAMGDMEDAALVGPSDWRSAASIA